MKKKLASNLNKDSSTLLCSLTIQEIHYTNWGVKIDTMGVCHIDTEQRIKIHVILKGVKNNTNVFKEICVLSNLCKFCLFCLYLSVTTPIIVLI